MQTTTVQRALELYRLSPLSMLPTEKGYRNESHPVRLVDGRTVNLILYKDEPGILATIKRIHAVSVFLANENFPVRLPIDGHITTIRYGKGQRYAALYNYLSGQTITWDGYTQKHLKLLGQTMGQMHATLWQYQNKDLPSVADQYCAIYERMRRYFADPLVSHAVAEKLGLEIPDIFMQSALRVLKACSRLPHQQALHMDFVRSNILFEPDAASPAGLQISGILDLEKVAYGHPLFDVARTLAFLMVDCKYKPAHKVRKYFLISGYKKRGGQPLPADNRLLEKLVDIFLLYDFYKFLRHNPYEYLSQNEHYIRTRDLLLERGVITTTTRYGHHLERLVQLVP